MPTQRSTTRRRFTITTAIPYVNGDPHLGYALELVEADVLARHRRLRGDAVRFQTGTDDNALKNVDAAVAAGVPVAEFVARAPRASPSSRGPARDLARRLRPHQCRPAAPPGVERLWRACAARRRPLPARLRGPLLHRLRGVLDPGRARRRPLPGARDPAGAGRRAELVLPALALPGALLELLEAGGCASSRSSGRNEVIAFVRGGLATSASRAAGAGARLGHPGAGRPGQVVYVWFDALANYVSALDYGGATAATRAGGAAATSGCT